MYAQCAFCCCVLGKCTYSARVKLKKEAAQKPVGAVAQKPKRSRLPITITLSPEAIEKGGKIAKYEGTTISRMIEGWILSAFREAEWAKKAAWLATEHGAALNAAASARARAKKAALLESASRRAPKKRRPKASPRGRNIPSRAAA
jgi:hypothetical protein